jgi:hypothetical protein
VIANVSCSRCRYSFQVDLPDPNKTYRTYCPKCRHEFDVGPPSYPTQPVPPPFTYPDEEYAKKQIMNAAYMRTRTDEVMSFGWILLPVIGYAAYFTILMATLLLDAGLFVFGIMCFSIIGVMVVMSIIYFLLYYKLINRRNEHFKRDMMLREGVIQFIHNRSYKTSRVYEVSADVGALQSIHSFAISEENEKSAVLWAILSLFVPFIGLYVMYFLTKDPGIHDSRQASFIRYVSSALHKLGITVQPSWKTIPQRSAILYLVLSLFIPFFFIYWFYVVIKDLNNHFSSQWVFENSLVNALR